MTANILLSFNLYLLFKALSYLASFPRPLFLTVPVGAVGRLSRVVAGARDHIGQRGHTAPTLAAPSLARTT